MHPLNEEIQCGRDSYNDFITVLSIYSICLQTPLISVIMNVYILETSN